MKCFLVLLLVLLSICTFLQAQNPEPAGWYVGDMHVHRSCGGSPVSVSTIYQKMSGQNLAAVSLLADMGNGEVQDPAQDLPLVNGADASVSTPGRIVHWDAEWHWDATYSQYPHQALGGHIVALGLTEAHQIWEEYTFPIFSWAHQQNAIAGFAHMQYLDGNFPQTLSCCTPIEYPVEVALGSADFVSEDVNGNDYATDAYYRLLNSGFRPGFAAGTDYPCNDGVTVGSPLTYVRVAGSGMTYRNWIEGISNGRTVVSRNGHNEFLDLKVNSSAAPGDEIHLTGGGTVQVTVQWTATQNLTGTIELVSNGVVVASKQASVTSGSAASLSAAVNFTKSGWLAARRMGSNEHVVHTAAVFVTVDNAPVRANAADPQFYVQWTDNLLAMTSPGGQWNWYFPTSLSAAQARYQAAKALYQQIALEAQGTSPTLSSITVMPGNQTISTGTTQQFTATGTYSNGTSLNITGQVVWASSNTSIANIYLRGLAAAVNAGTAVISARLGGVSASTSVTVQIPPLVITPQSLPDGTANAAYSATLAASGGTPPYTWSIASGSLPIGTSLNSGTGVISGTPTATGTFNFTAQVIDSGSPAQIATKALSIVIASPGMCPCTIWPSTAAPAIADSGPDSAVEIGVKFRADSDGYITAIRFYKGVGNAGTHVGNLWTSGGTRLATATFTNETSSGWQQVNLSNPVAIKANTVYAASYHTNVGHYADDQYYFATGVDRAPLHALADGVSGADGVYVYGSSSAFPNQSWNQSNYWVDVVFTPSGPDVTPPTVTSVTPPNGAASVAVDSTMTATFSEAMDAATINSTTFVLRDSQGATVAATANYNSSTNTAVLTPTSALQYSMAYTAVLKGGSTDPRVKDSAGNPLASDFTWSFTTVDPPPPPAEVTLNSITVSPASLTGGASSLATVTLTGVAPPGGAAVTLLSSDNPVAQVPPSVTVLAGTSSATVTVNTVPVSGSTQIIISATHNGTTKQATLVVNPPAVSSITLSPSTVVGGNSSTTSVTLTGAAPTAGYVVALTSSNPSVATVPASVTVPVGATNTTFPVTTLPVSASSTVTITASAAGVTRQATLTVNPALTVSNLTLNATSVVGGGTSTATITLSAKAPAGGVAVSLQSSSPAVAIVPATKTVAAGSSTATFTVTTFPVSANTIVTISASLNGVTKSVDLTVKAPTPTPSALTVNPSTVTGGSPSKGTVTLNGIAPADGVTVALSSAKLNLATVPASVLVLAGSQTATFTITTLPQPSSKTVKISATANNVSKSATLTVTP